MTTWTSFLRSSRVYRAREASPLKEHGSPFDGIVLAGASSKRFGGADKALVELAGRSFLARSLDALSNARTRVVVGPDRTGFRPSRWVQENPLDGGPVSALGAGLRATDCAIVVVLAVDMPLVDSDGVCRLLERLSGGDADAVVLTDASGRTSYLAGAYRRDPLLSKIRELPALEGARLRDVVRDLKVQTLVSPAARDCDSPEELRRLETELRA